MIASFQKEVYNRLDRLTGEVGEEKLLCANGAAGLPQ